MDSVIKTRRIRMVQAFLLGGLFIATIAASSFAGIAFGVRSLVFSIPAAVLVMSAPSISGAHSTNAPRLTAVTVAAVAPHRVVWNVVSGLAFVVLFIVALLLGLTNDIHDLSYLVACVALACLVVSQVLVLRPPSWLVLSELMLVTMKFSLLTTLVPAFYIGWGDIVAHMAMAGDVARTGEVSRRLLSYEQFPLLHVLQATFQQVSSLPVRQAYHTSAAVMAAFMVLLVASIGAAVAPDKRLPLLAATIFAFNRELLFYGAYFVTRTLAAILFLALLLFLLRSPATRPRWVIGAGLLAAAISYTHQVSSIFFVGAIGLLAASHVLANSRAWSSRLARISLILLIITLGKWTLEAGLFWPVLIRNLHESLTSELLLTASASPRPNEAHAELLRAAIFVVTRIDLIALMVLAGIAVIALLHAWRNCSLPRPMLGFLLGSAALSSLFFPNPLFVLPVLSKILLIYRFPLVVAPFLAIVVACGILRLLQARGVAVAFAVVVIAAGGGILNDYVSGSSAELSRVYGTGALFFSEPEMATFAWGVTEVPQITRIASDRDSGVYLSLMEGRETSQVEMGESLPPSAVAIIREQTWEERYLSFSTKTVGYADEMLKLPFDAAAVNRLEQGQNRVYSSGGSTIYGGK